MKHPFDKYVDGVLSGKVPACDTIKSACRRHKNDLERSDIDPDFPFVFDKEKVDRIIRFSNLMTHWQGAKAGDKFEPEGWQLFIFGSIYGWVHEKSGLRRFNTAYIEVPRKNGKTFMSATLAAYAMVGDNEQGAEVYSVANKREQAMKVWTDVEKAVSKSPVLGKMIKKKWIGSVQCLVAEKTDSVFKALASDYTKNDGLNPHLVIFDELHELKDPRLWDVIDEAFGARLQHLLFIITTAGYNDTGICYEQHEKTLAVLDDKGYDDDAFFGFIAQLEDKKKWNNETEWARANPNLNVSKSLDYMRKKFVSASNVPSQKNAFLNKQLNVWTKAREIWLDMDRYDRCEGTIDERKLTRERCFVGMDLSTSTDLTAITAVFPPNSSYGEYQLISRFFLPEDNIEDRQASDRAAYVKWINQGYIETTEGNVVDLEYVKQAIREWDLRYSIVEIGFDPWKAVEIATSLEKEGFAMVQMRQGFGTLGPPSAKLEALIASGMLRHGNNPVLRWMMGNTSIIRDVNDNFRPDKSATTTRIDGVLSTIMGLGRVMVDESQDSIYENQGIRTI